MTHSDRSPAAALLLGIALVVSALILSGTWKDHQKSNQTLDVSGSAEKPIVSDLGFFRCSLTGDGRTAREAFAPVKSRLAVHVPDEQASVLESRNEAPAGIERAMLAM